MSFDFKQGSTRNVILVGDWALKFPRMCEWRLFLRGLLANIQESQFFGFRFSNVLCPVLWAIPGGFLLCMRRAEPLRRDVWERMDIERWLKEQQLSGICEGKLDCFGIVNGQTVVVDYGA